MADSNVFSDHNAPQKSLSDQSIKSTDTQAVVNVPEGVPFAADDDFEWDEREIAWASHTVAHGQLTTSGDEDASMRSITDGMATLTANASNTGFLGTVSGAALLRQMTSTPSESQTADQTPGEERRSSIVDYLSSQ